MLPFFREHWGNPSSGHAYQNWNHDCGGPDATTTSGCSFAEDYADMISVVAGLGGETAPDREAGTGIDCGKQRRNVGRIVLTVGVDDHHRVGVMVESPPQARPNCAAHPEIEGQLDARNACIPSDFSSAIRGAVVDDNWDEPVDLGDLGEHTTQGRLLVEGGDDGDGAHASAFDRRSASRAFTIAVSGASTRRWLAAAAAIEPREPTITNTMKSPSKSPQPNRS